MRSSWKKFFISFLFGVSSGIPLLATGGTLQAWMKDEGVNLATIGLFSFVGLPYTLKFLWAPLFDRFTISRLGRRRGWAIVIQCMLMLALFLLGTAHPKENPIELVILALIVTFWSASQDIVLDAYRREIFDDSELGLGASLFVNGYRVGMLISGAVALSLADLLPWSSVYLIIAGSMIIGLVTTIFSQEPQAASLPRTFREVVIEPFTEYFQRPHSLEILAFILLYKVGDTLASAMSTLMILDSGFSKTELAAIAKTFGLFSLLCGGFVGGILMIRIGIARALWLFGFLQAVGILAFSVVPSYPAVNLILILAVVVENFTSGLGTSAYTAFLGSVTNRKFSATQYALLSSLMGVPRVVFAGFSGTLAQFTGWQLYYILCTLSALPGLLMLRRVAPWEPDRSKYF